MKITEVKIRKIFNEGVLKAIVSITIDNCLAVHEIKVIQGNSRLFAAMPSRRDENGVFRDIIHPIYSEARKEFEDVIIKAYNDYIVHNEQNIEEKTE
ncbi:MAG: septation regulator SpoVG [Ruminiclostridium sp.]